MELGKITETVQDPPHKIKVGDRVVVTCPSFVKRVGYPMGFEDAVNEVERLYRKRIIDLLEFREPAVATTPPELFKSLRLVEDPAYEPREYSRVLRAVANAYRRVKGYGGPERRIHTHRLECELGRVHKVMAMRVVKTGDYFPPSVYTDHYGEKEHEPGGLSDPKTHVLLRLNNDMHFMLASPYREDMSDELWIERCNVRRLDDGQV